MYRKLFCFLQTIALLGAVFCTSAFAAVQEAPVIECEGLDSVVMNYRVKDNVYVGKMLVPAGQKEYIFSIKNKEDDQVIGTQVIKFHENATTYKIAFTYNPSTNMTTNDYITAFQGLDNKVAIGSLYFNSRDGKSKSHLGPVTKGTEVTFTLEAKANDLEKANLVLSKQKIIGQQTTIEYLEKKYYSMEKTGYSTDNTREYWTAKIMLDDLNVYCYYFEAIDGKDVVIYANNSMPIPIASNRVLGIGGVGEALRLAVEGMSEEAIPRYRQTVYDPAFFSPDWAKDIIYYYIFPERFKNGNKANDPKVGVNKFYGKKDIEFHKNWLGSTPGVPGDGKSDNEYCNDFYGGDLAGVLQKLDYLKELGINTIYMTPIFQAPSNHKYDTADYKQIDPGFGTNEEYKQLNAEAKKKGIRIIMDASLNHSGADSVYMDRYGKYPTIGAFEKQKIRKDSPYYDWYIFDEKEMNPDKKYPQWANPTLAEFNKESESYRNFAMRGKDSVMKYWLDMGISGWRMDVVPWVPDEFWREWRKEVKGKNPDALTICETWWDSSKYLLGDMFDSGMNYVFRAAVNDYVDGKNAQETVNLLEMLQENYPAPAFYSAMNIVSSHDAPRAVYRFGYKNEQTPADQIKVAKDKLKLATFIQMTYPGAPTIYYGDEVGVTGGEDPFNRGPYPWKEEGGQPDNELFKEFQKLIKLRTDNGVLRRGTLQTIYVDNNAIVMLRTYEGAVAIVATNNQDQAKTVKINVSALNLPSTLVDALNEDQVTVKNGILEMEIPALYGRVLVTK